MKHIVIPIIIGFLIPYTAYCKNQNFFDYERKVEVPEPMFIDLVRSLNAKKGETEVNTLFSDYASDAERLKWAPEFEYAYNDGQAIEFEFPSVGNKLENYKFAFQKNITALTRKNCLQGFQVIYETDKEFSHSESTIYHIYALRMNHQFSIMNIAGIKFDNQDVKKRSVALNSTLFYNHTHEVDFGLEVNLESSELGNKFFQVLPQVHLALNKGYKIQYGFGAAKVNDDSSLVTSFRLIKEFNL